MLSVVSLIDTDSSDLAIDGSSAYTRKRRLGGGSSLGLRLTGRGGGEATATCAGISVRPKGRSASSLSGLDGSPSSISCARFPRRAARIWSACIFFELVRAAKETSYPDRPYLTRPDVR